MNKFKQFILGLAGAVALTALPRGRCTMPEKNQTMRAVAPEDIRAETYVTLLREVIEVFPFGCLSESSWRKIEPLRVTVSCDEAGTPLRVIDVCLPFILVEDPCCRHRTLDVRRHQVARLKGRYARKAFDRMRADAKKRRKHG